MKSKTCVLMVHERVSSTVRDSARRKRSEKSAGRSLKRSVAVTLATGGRHGGSRVEGQSEFANLARQHWLKETKKQSGKVKPVKVKNDVLKREIWDTLRRRTFLSSRYWYWRAYKLWRGMRTRQDSPTSLRHKLTVECAATCGPVTQKILPTITSY